MNVAPQDQQTTPAPALPAQAQVVVVGGGIVGCSVAWHLVRAGVSDVLLLERDRLTSGTTWHAAGIVGPVRDSVTMTQLHHYATEALPLLERETGQMTGYRRTGGFNLAQCAERMQEFARFVTAARAAGAEAELVTPAELRAALPQLRTADLLGGVWIAADGHTNPTDTTVAFARGASAGGARIVEGVRVDAIERSAGRVCGVRTTAGAVRCQTLVVCAGIWSRALGAGAGTAIPLQAVEHMYFVSEDLGLAPGFPVLRDFDASTYYKGDAGRLVFGGFDRDAKPWCVDGIAADSSFTLLDEDWGHFEFVMRAALERVPALARAGIRQFLTGPESFTVDGRYCLGESPAVAGLFVAAGFNSAGIMAAAGAGRALAEWIVDGQPQLDLWALDVRRFEGWEANRAFVAERVREVVGLHFAMHWPQRQYERGRDIRRTPLHAQWQQRGAVMGVSAGWERPFWFAANAAEARWRHSFGAQAWWPAAAREAQALTDRTVLFELSPLTKLELAGPGALAALQRLCASNLDVAPGRVLYTQMLNARGGIECDLTVTRLAHAHFRLVSAAATRCRDLSYLQRRLCGARVVLSDVTGAYAVLGLMGPGSRALLTQVCGEDLAPGAFGFGQARLLELGCTPVLAQRLSFAGELGYELFIPLEFARHVLAVLQGAGAGAGLHPAGFLCLDGCRLEKGFAHFGHDLGPGLTPLEAGLGCTLDLDKGDFSGRAALLAQRERPLRRRLLSLTVEQGNPLLLHDEPLYREGQLLGYTTSGGFGFRLGKPVALALLELPREYPQALDQAFVAAGGFEVEVAGVRYPARLHWHAPYDPAHRRMRA